MEIIMKKIFVLFLSLAALVSATSCEDWLKATSSTQIQADDLFESKDGFKDALMGVYILMGGNKNYGAFLTYSTLDIASYPYSSFYGADKMSWQQHTYSTVTVLNEVKASWLNMYKVIANINEILNFLELSESLFSDDLEYKLFLGELYGLRAYVHFDMMRLYGTASWTGENASKVTVPYVTAYTKEPTPQLSYEQTCQLLLSDINNALECLVDDPVRGTVSDSFQNTCNAEGFWNNRTSRFNYYAAKALEARYYQWMKQYPEASAAAKEVIDELDGNHAVKWIDVEDQRIIISNDEKDWTFTPEHIFSLDITGLYVQAMSLLMPGASGAMGDVCHINQEFIDNVLYPMVDPNTGSLAGAEDIRGTAMLMKLGASSYDCYKLYGSSSYSRAYVNRMPLIKLPELYYIMADACIAADDSEGAFEILNTVRHNRGISDDLPDTADLALELNKEYMREFVNEGQIFFRLKSTGLEKYPAEDYFKLKASDFIFPYPTEELNYGRKQEL